MLFTTQAVPKGIFIQLMRALTIDDFDVVQKKSNDETSDHVSGVILSAKDSIIEQVKALTHAEGEAVSAFKTIPLKFLCIKVTGRLMAKRYTINLEGAGLGSLESQQASLELKINATIAQINDNLNSYIDNLNREVMSSISKMLLNVEDGVLDGIINEEQRSTLSNFAEEKRTIEAKIHEMQLSLEEINKQAYELKRNALETNFTQNYGAITQQAVKSLNFKNPNRSTLASCV